MGVGMLYFDLRHVINCIHYRSRKTVVEILDNHSVHSIEFEHRLFECPRCDTLHSRFHVRIVYDEGQIYETHFKCRRCRSQLRPAERTGEAFLEYARAVDSYSCRKCGEKALETNGVVLWD